MMHRPRVSKNNFAMVALLAAGLATAVACGTAEEPEATVPLGPTVTGTLSLPAATRVPAPTRTQAPALSPTRAVLPTATRLVQPTPTRFVTSTRPGVTLAPTPVRTPTPFLAPTPTRVVLATRVTVPTPTSGSMAPTPTRVSAGIPTPTVLIPTSTPFATRTPAPGLPTSTPVAGSSTLTAALSFAHTQPDVQSEVYLDIEAQSGTAVSATLSGPGIVGSAVQSGAVASNGRLRLTWTINIFGNYSVTGLAGSSSFSDSIRVL